VEPSEANEILRYGIAVLRGQNIVCKLSGRVQIALILMKRLSEEGFWWQVKILQYWIHRAQGGQLCVE
jgi:hypothetical protein